MSPLFLFFTLMVSTDSTTYQDMVKFFPTSFSQWNASELPQHYSGNSIFDYMDGAGEVYLAYNYQHLLVQRYSASQQEEILVEFFDMGNSKNAFGIFSYMKGRGPEYPIGQDAEYKNGLLCFWKGQYFIYVHIDNETTKAKEAVLAIGKQISQAIPSEGKRPDILQMLPEGKYISTSLRYFFRFEILNTHFYIANKNILHLNDNTEGILVRIKSIKCRLLIISYPSELAADSAYVSFTKQYMPDAKESGIVMTEKNKWTVCLRQKRYLTIAFDASTKTYAFNLLTTVHRRLP